MISDQPIHQVEWIPIEKVHANDYNPNSVATQEMKLLYRSVKADGYTQPVVTIYDGMLSSTASTDTASCADSKTSTLHARGNCPVLFFMARP